MLCAKFDWYWLISPLGEGRGPSIEQTWIVYNQGSFVPSLVEISPVVLEEEILKILLKNYLLIIFPWIGRGPSFEQNWIPITQGCFVPSLIEIGPVVLEKKKKMWKVYNNDNDYNYDGQRTNCDQKSSLEPSAQVS